MAFTDIRQGARTRVAAKFQTALGTPATVFANADILRAESAPAPDPGQELMAQQGTHGSLYKIATAVEVSRTPTVEAVVKAGPDNLRLFLQNCIGVAPVVTPGSPYDTYKFEGFETEFPATSWLTYVWDDGFESLRVHDLWTHTFKLVSEAKENLLLELSGTGYSFTKLGSSVLAGLSLSNIDSYAHKGSLLIDNPAGPAVNLAVKGIEIEIDHGRQIINANSVAPTYLAKDGRISVSGRINFGRIYADDAVFLDRVLNVTGSTLKAEWTAASGRKLFVTLRNVILQGTFPDVDTDGTMSDFELDFEAYQTPPGGTFPVTIEIED